ncbi:MAG TPA: hypothetical protein VEH02_09970 [Pseudolabrys sp.]|nr:hypothetical protein [Pseudolabrys sp.]
MLKRSTIICLFAVAGLFASGWSGARSRPVVLITADEAQRPPVANADLTFRAGISRGPAIELVSPKPSEKSVRSPVHLQLKFEGRGGAQIDVDTLRLTYIRNPSADLTSRVKGFAKADGIDVPEADIPPGTHIIRADVKDKEGRSGSLIFKLNVVN